MNIGGLRSSIDGHLCDSVIFRLTSVDGQAYIFNNNGNLLTIGAMTNTWDATNRLIETAVSSQPLAVSYDGLNNRVAQTVSVTTTYFALDVQGLPEVIYISDDNAYLHLPGVIMTESATGTVRYLLSDGLGSVRQAVDEGTTMVSYKEFDPYGNLIVNGQSEIVNRYGYTGEWWEEEVGLLYLRARWYAPGTGSFLSRDPVEGEPSYIYARGNPTNLVDPSGMVPPSIDLCFEGCPHFSASGYGGGHSVMVSALFHSGGIIPSAIVSAIASALFHSEGIIPVNLSWGIETALCGENELQIAQNLAWRSRCAQRE